MIGLLKKEYYLMEGQMKSWLIVAVFCFFYSYFMNADSFLFMLIKLIGIMSTMTVFSHVCRHSAIKYILLHPPG